jgi:hypothetical protein
MNCVCRSRRVPERDLVLDDHARQFLVGELAHVVVANTMILRGLAPAAAWNATTTVARVARRGLTGAMWLKF